MDRAPQAGRSAIVVVMKNWAGIAQANGLTLSAGELDRIVGPLAALEENNTRWKQALYSALAR